MPKKKAAEEKTTEKKARKTPLKKKFPAPKKEAKKSLPKDVSARDQEGKESGQPEINVGLVGHVDHGKTTLTEALSGKWTDTHSEELKRGITIRLGYADVIIRKCEKCDLFTIHEKCEACDGPAVFQRKISLVDAPGHESLMATMLSGATIMDGALLLIAANEVCPQPQTREHLMALKISGIKNVIVIQNKVDLIPKERVMRNYQQIKEFLKNTEFKGAPIIPVSALKRVNVDVVLSAIQKYIPSKVRDESLDPIMIIARSFDINKPGVDPAKMSGGVLGGTIVQGSLGVGDRVEIRPGRVVVEANKLVAKPLFSKVLSAQTGGQQVERLHPGGSVAILTSLDPGIVKGDSLGGNVAGLPDKLPPVWYDLTLETHLLERVVGSEEELKVDNIKLGEMLMLNVNSASTVGVVTELGKNKFMCKLKLPICAEKDAKITISRRIGTRFRLIGYGVILEN
ncbi:MAG: translation initiation factor IF-2 subunit gamma [Nanoarchaeota archaeon]